MMKTISKAQEKRDERANAETVLREHLKPGDTVFTILRHVSGKSFWIKMFRPRPEEWRAETLKRLLAGRNIFDTAANQRNKIAALEELQNENA